MGKKKSYEICFPEKKVSDENTDATWFMGQKEHDPKNISTDRSVVWKFMVPFCLCWMLIRMFAWHGTAGQLYSRGCSSSKRSKIVSCVMPIFFVSSINLLKVEESRRMHVLQ